MGRFTSAFYLCCGDVDHLRSGALSWPNGYFAAWLCGRFGHAMGIGADVWPIRTPSLGRNLGGRLGLVADGGAAGDLVCRHDFASRCRVFAYYDWRCFGQATTGHLCGLRRALDPRHGWLLAPCFEFRQLWHRYFGGCGDFIRYRRVYCRPYDRWCEVLAVD